VCIQAAIHDGISGKISGYVDPRRGGTDDGKDERESSSDEPGTAVPGTDVPGTNVPGTNVPGTDVPGTNVSAFSRGRTH